MLIKFPKLFWVTATILALFNATMPDLGVAQNPSSECVNESQGLFIDKLFHLGVGNSYTERSQAALNMARKLCQKGGDATTLKSCVEQQQESFNDRLFHQGVSDYKQRTQRAIEQTIEYCASNSNSISSGTGKPEPVSDTVTGFRICNQTGFSLSTAFGYSGRAKGWWAKGWWTLDPGDCKVVYKHPLRERYYYIYAESKSERLRWGGNYNFCVSDQDFNLASSSNCEENQAGFRQVDVGNSYGYTYNIRR